jgi:membrane-associated protease RseP (regulator of RpoE activity)
MLAWFAKSIFVIYAFLFVIFMHELGHYIVGRLLKLKISEFSIGIGPVKFLPRFIDKRGTVWRLGLLPIGGYVRPMHKEALQVEEGGLVTNMLGTLDNFLEQLFRPLQRLFNLIHDPVNEKLVKGRKYIEDLKPLQLIALANLDHYIDHGLRGCTLA